MIQEKFYLGLLCNEILISYKQAVNKCYSFAEVKISLQQRKLYFESFSSSFMFYVRDSSVINMINADLTNQPGPRFIYNVRF